MINTPFEGVWKGSISFSDVNNDGSNDVLITGENSSTVGISKLYINDGFGNFMEMTSTPFEVVIASSIAFSDVDGDGNDDVLITGNNFNSRIAKLYMNDGLGNFMELAGTSFEGVARGSVALSDVNGDGKVDVFITGRTSSNEDIAKLCLNDGVISSINDLAIDSTLDFNLYPNPTISNNLNINFDSEENVEIIIQVYNLNGVLVKRQIESVVVGSQNLSINIATLSAGSYFIQVDNGKRKGAAKFFVY